jgi:hypothetical protein
MSIGILVLAVKTLKERGGGLVLLRPQKVAADPGDHGRRPCDHHPRTGPRRVRGQGRLIMHALSTPSRVSARPGIQEVSGHVHRWTNRTHKLHCGNLALL